MEIIAEENYLLLCIASDAARMSTLWPRLRNALIQPSSIYATALLVIQGI